MNRARLEHLIEVLEKIPPEKFDIETWTNPCGTVCCALGWAASDPQFIAQGLHLVKDDNDGFLFLVALGPEAGYRAGANFFDISMRESLDLFSPESYADEAENLGLLDGDGDTDLSRVRPQHVIARIKELLA